MLRFIFTKIKNKYRLYLALLAGIISMIAVFGVIMMLRKGSLDRLIQSEFKSQYEKTGTFPALISRTGTQVLDDSKPAIDFVMENVEGYESSWDQYLELPVLASQRIIWMKGRRALFSYRGESGYLDLGYLDTDYNGEHITLLDGTLPGDAELPEGHYGCLIDRHTMDVNHFVVGETLTMNDMNIKDDKQVVFHITGVISETGFSDYYWQKGLADNGVIIYLTGDDFSSIAAEHHMGKAYYETYRVYDYRKLTDEKAGTVEDYLAQFREMDEGLTENLSEPLRAASQKAVSVKAVLYAISVPLIALVLLFIGMIAVRILDSEQGEIAMLHSRGKTRGKIVLIYLVQSLIIAAISFAPGLFAGYLLGRLTASATGFLEFSGDAVTGYGIYPGMIAVSAAAALLSVIVMLVPVIPRSRDTILQRKHRKAASGIPVWEKYFLDIVLLGASIYLLYNFTRQLDSLKISVLSGEGTDPVIFLSATFFLLSCGLLILRLFSYLVRALFRLRRKKLSPANYASLLQIIRTRKSSGVISVFLVLTIAMSVFNANMARTINANQEERLRYDLGADVVINEQWQLRVLSLEKPQRWKYDEPDGGIYEDLVRDGLAESVTHVIRDDNTLIKLGRNNQEIGSLMGINTKEFGETARLRDGLTDEHWFTYLNELSKVTNGCLISQNLAEKYDLKVGDTITYSRFSPVEVDYVYASSAGVIRGIVDAFPGYDTYEYVYNENGELTEKERYLIVANFSNVVSSFEKTPYSVWVRTDQPAAKLQEYLEEKLASAKRTLKSVEGAAEDIREMQDSSMIKITNGLFTLNVLVALLLCVLGYLIHWITSIRDRELLFGIYRAMGITMGEVSRMLTIEQIFTSLGPVLAGIGAGSVATVLFAKLFSVVYLPEKHAVELTTYVSGADFLRLGLIIGGAMILCFLVIHGIVRRMKITEALKLGED